MESFTLLTVSYTHLTGKSTLISILTGALLPDAGQVIWDRKARLGYLDQHAHTDGSVTLDQLLHSAFEGLYQTEERMIHLMQQLTGQELSLIHICSFAFAPELKTGYFQQELAWDDPGLTPLALMAERFPGMMPKLLRSALARCGLRAQHALQPVGTLSGGEQSKVKLCPLTLTPAHLLVDVYKRQLLFHAQ